MHPPQFHYSALNIYSTTANLC